MKRLLLIGTTTLILMAAVVFSRNNSLTQEQARQRELNAALKIDVEQRNPWTHLNLKNKPEEFQFVIVSDRTGGHRAQIFSRAVQQINLLRPEFVLSVGDLIEGYTEDVKRLDSEWKEFQGFVEQLEMPFFYVPGNHDITNVKMEKKWKEKFGRHHYHFVYHDVLFLILNTEDPPKSKGGANLSKQQLAWAEKVLADNKDVRWTIVSLHKPMWNSGAYKPGENGWLEMEKLLKGRKYSVFAGHYHTYRKYVRQGMNYYQLATTGGGSRMRGPHHSEMDHIVWVTMTQKGPRLCNLMLDGIYTEDLKLPESTEAGTKRTVVKTYSVTGRVTFRGKPLEQAQLTFFVQDPKDRKKLRRAAIGTTRADGSYALTAYQAFDGCPAGECKVTVVRVTQKLDGSKGENTMPANYADTKTTPLQVTVRKGENSLDFNLK